MSTHERLFTMENLIMLRLRGVQLERTNSFDLSEYKFTVSAYDLAHNLLGIEKARLAEALAEVVFPYHRNITKTPVSDLDETQFILNDG